MLEGGCRGGSSWICQPLHWDRDRGRGLLLRAGWCQRHSPPARALVVAGTTHWKKPHTSKEKKTHSSPDEPEVLLHFLLAHRESWARHLESVTSQAPQQPFCPASQMDCFTFLFFPMGFSIFFLVAEGGKLRFSASIKCPWISAFPSRGSDIDLEIPNNRISFIPHSEMAETVKEFLIRELNEARASECSGP